MNERIPILYSSALLPEWIDFGLEQFMRVDSEMELRKIYLDYLTPQIQEKVTRSKTVDTLLRTVGYKSCIPKAKLEEIYSEMSSLSPDQRSCLRLILLTEANPFVSDCLVAMNRLAALGKKEVEIKHIYERLVAKYGDRSTVYRRARYVFQTLALLGVVENIGRRWTLLGMK